MNKSELVNHVKDTTELSKAQAEEAVKAVLSGLEGALVGGGDIRLAGFGNFSVKSVEARKGRNPKTGAELDIPATKKVVFKVASELKKSVAA